VMCKLIPVIW